MDFTKLKEYMERLVGEYDVPGVDCIVTKEHNTVFRYMTGFCDRENKKQISENNLFLIFSLTKMLTCVCALQLFEKGAFLMNDAISQYLPEYSKMKISNVDFDGNTSSKITNGSQSGENVTTDATGFAKNPITVKHLFTMSAGLDYDLNAPYIKEAISQGKTSTRDIVYAISQTVLGFEPGTRFRYSLCHDVLGALIEVWSGKSLGEYMKENLLEPLGMKDTFFGVPKDESRLSRMAALYVYDKDRNAKRVTLECPFNFTGQYESGGAGLVSSTSDYSLFLEALANGGVGRNGNRILSPNTISLMSTNHLNERQIQDFEKLRKGYGYGLGVRTHIDKTKSGSSSPLGEFGWDGAAGAFSLVDTENNLSFTYFQHARNWDVRIETEMRNILYTCLDR